MFQKVTTENVMSGGQITVIYCTTELVKLSDALQLVKKSDLWIEEIDS